MLTKDQANAAADVLLEANKSAPQVKRKAFKNVKFRAIGGILGLVIAFAISQAFDVKFLMIGVISMTTGTLLGERIGKRRQTTEN